ncbi:ankyrin repeat domain-containing protein 50-like [Microplitis demolitor]|uniref:ankyrin repeat domain-containing protein 50-like n=1 Tax=Microplitis demolitor TaxID=69319 RepID=UPI00235B694E|nr:ankyrin repeat domain-containing protein 50-like [Microplitis demolitor]
MEILRNVEFENINLNVVKDLFNQSPHLGVNIVFSLGADVNVCADGTGETPLFCAVRQNNLEMSKYLIELGADVNLKCSKHKHLVDNNAVVDARAEDGNRPLLAAAFRGHIDVMKRLLAHGADLNSRTKRSHWMATVLHDVLFSTKSEVLEFLCNLDDEATNVNTLTKNNISLLHCFLKYFGRVDWIIHTLLNAGIDVNVVDCDDKLAIDYKKQTHDPEKVHPDIVIVQQHIV